MDSPLAWAGIWLAVGAVFGIGEILIAGSFFLAPFAAGAVVAALVSLFGAPLLASWLAFILASVGFTFLLRPLAKRLDLDVPNPIGVGANRLIGLTGAVIEEIPSGATQTGQIKVGGEEWRAEGRHGMGLAVGAEIRIVDVKGTRVVVEPAEPSRGPST